MSCIHIFLSILTVFMISSLNYWYYSCFLYRLSFSYRASNVIVFKFKSIFSPSSLSLFSRLLQERVQNVVVHIAFNNLFRGPTDYVCGICHWKKDTKSGDSQCLHSTKPSTSCPLPIYLIIPTNLL